MKKLLALLVCLSLLAPITLTQSGCANPGATSHKVEVTTIPSVNAAMDQWKDYVLAGKASQAQLDQIKSAYQVYFTAQVHAKAAELAWVNSKLAQDQTAFTDAAADAATKGAGVIALVTTYMTVKK